MKNEEIQNLIKELIEKVNVKTTQISMLDDSGTNRWFSVQVEEPHFFTGRDGEALYALNHIARRIVDVKQNLNQPENRDKNKEGSILIDINDFQKKRVDNIRAVAHMMGERARYFKSNIEVDPMSAFERRVIHEFLSTAEDLKTESAGFGRARHVVIKYVGEI